MRTLWRRLTGRQRQFRIYATSGASLLLRSVSSLSNVQSTGDVGAYLENTKRLRHRGGDGWIEYAPERVLRSAQILGIVGTRLGLP